MRIHRNAQTTPMTRYLLVERVRHQGWGLQDVCGAMGISRQTGRKWLQRSQTGGTVPLVDRSSAPRREARRTPPAVTAAIVALCYKRLSAWAIATRLQVPRSTVATVLARKGLDRLARVGAIGHRIHGDLDRKTRGLGWECVHVCVDDFSRAASVEVLPAKTAVAAARFLQRAVRWFAARGVRVERVLTDNDGAYRAGVFEAAVTRAATKHRFTRPYRPQNQREGRTLYPNDAPRMGACQALSQLRAADTDPAPMAPALQHPASAYESGVSSTSCPFPESRTVNNVIRNNN